MKSLAFVTFFLALMLAVQLACAESIHPALFLLDKFPSREALEGKMMKPGVKETGEEFADFGAGRVEPYDYEITALFSDKKWMLSSIGVLRRSGKKLGDDAPNVFKEFHHALEGRFGKSPVYEIDASITEDGESGSESHAACWSNKDYLLELNMSRQGTSNSVVSLIIYSLDYYSDQGFLGESVKRHYRENVFPSAGNLPDSFGSGFVNAARHPEPSPAIKTHNLAKATDSEGDVVKREGLLDSRSSSTIWFVGIGVLLTAVCVVLASRFIRK